MRVAQLRIFLFDLGEAIFFVPTADRLRRRVSSGQGWPPLGGHPKGLSLTAVSTATGYVTRGRRRTSWHGTCAFHFPCPLQRLGSGSGKAIKNRAFGLTKKRDPAQKTSKPRRLLTFSSLVKAALLGTTAATQIEIWFQDEARVGQKGTHAYIWAPIGSRPLMVRDNRHDSAYIFGAICPARGVGAAMIMPAANAEGMNEHLKELSTQVTPSSIAVVICDGAGWHQRGKELIVPDNIRLLSLPPYSPD
jgi:hypothetical protein